MVYVCVKFVQGDNGHLCHMIFLSSATSCLLISIKKIDHVRTHTQPVETSLITDTDYRLQTQTKTLCWFKLEGTD